MAGEFIEFAVSLGYKTPEAVNRLVNRILLSASPVTRNRTAMTNLIQYARMMRQARA